MDALQEQHWDADLKRAESEAAHMHLFLNQKAGKLSMEIDGGIMHPSGRTAIQADRVSILPVICSG